MEKKLGLLYFSTFLGRSGIYLEDLYIKFEYLAEVMEKHCLNSWLKKQLKEIVDA